MHDFKTRNEAIGATPAIVSRPILGSGGQPAWDEKTCRYFAAGKITPVFLWMLPPQPWLL
jgi:hypothetical protein